MFEFVWWLLIGLAVGGMARFVYPGKQNMSLYGTITVGMIGSLIGGGVCASLYEFNPMQPGYHTVGLVMSAVGAIVVLSWFVANSRRSAQLAKRVL